MDTETQTPGDGPVDEGQSERQHALDQALEGLNDINRIQIEGIMATDGALTEDQVTEIRGIARRYQKETGISNEAVAKLAHISPGTYSQFLSGRYPGDNSAIAKKINNGIERDARQRAARRPTEGIATRAAETMGSFIQLADKLVVMLAIVADSGAGKTHTLKYWCGQTNGILITCVAGMLPRDLYRKIAEALGIHKDRATRMELLNLIIEKLVGSKRIIFIDEAHLLFKHIGCVRPIFDLAKVPIVMAGAAEILQQIDADRNHGIGQMASRTLRCDLTKITAKEIGKSGRRAPAVLFGMDEIAKFFQMKKMRITRDGLQMMFKLANLAHRGRLRLVENLADTIFNANPELQAITLTHVVAALELVAGDMAEALLRDADDLFDAGSPAGAAVAMAG